VWELVKSDFLNLMATLSGQWRDFLQMMGLSGASADEAVTNFLEASGDAAERSIKLAREASEAFTSGFDTAREAAAKLRAQVDSTADATDDGSKSADALSDALKSLDKGARKAAKGLDKAKSEAEAFADALEDAALTAEDMGKAKADILVSGIGGVSDAWGDFVSRGFSDFKGFAKSIVDSFKRMLAQMVALAARNRIMISLGLGGAGVGGAAQAAAGAAGSGGGLLNLLGGGANLLTGGGLLAGIAGGAGAALGIGGYASAGLFNIGANAAVASAATGAGAFASTIGAALPALGIIAGGIAILAKGLSREHHGRAVRGTLGPDGFDGFEFDFYQGGFLRGDKSVRHDTREEIQTMLDSATTGIVNNIETMAGALNLGAEAIKDFEWEGEQFTVWLTGRNAGDQEATAKEFEKHLNTLANGMTDLILKTEEYTREGESSYDALTRLGGSLIAVNDTLDLLGQTALEASLKGGDAASHLVDTFGGLEAMTGAISTYWNGFYSEAERQATTLQRLEKQFEALGVSMPESRAGFRELVESIDLTSASGRELYVDLLELSGALDQVLPKVGAYTEAMQGIVDQIGGEIGVQIGAAQNMVRISEQSAQLWYRTASTLRDFLSDLLNTDLTAASRTQSAALNRSRFETAFNMARGGDIDAARDIPELAKAYLNSARANASTSLEYRRIAATVQGQVNFLAGISELEGANDDVLRGLYEKQIEVLTNLGGFLRLEGLTAEQVGELSDGVQALAEDWDGTVAAFEGSLQALTGAIENAEVLIVTEN
jgi:ABC-type transporter Mla subunit MlaD